MICSICKIQGHKKNNRKFHTKKEVEEYNNKILAKKLVGNIFKKIIKEHRKSADYQCTELICALMLLGLSEFNYDKICNFIKIMSDKGRLKYKNDNILEEYKKDLKESLQKKTIKKSYIDNFIEELKTYKELDLDKIDYVYLTGKSISFQEILEQNEMFKKMKPNSDVYFKINNVDLLWGFSCKQSFESPCTNKIVEVCGFPFELEYLLKCREKDLNDNDITVDNFKTHRCERYGGDGKINDILSTKSYYTENKSSVIYWKALINHIIRYKKYFINEIINSMCQGEVLPYPVYEYDGETIVNTKHRKLDPTLCDIKESEIFCWGVTGPRNASKIWFDFLYENNDIPKYKLEVRFKGEYFGKGGQPQLFIYKVNKDDIKKCKEVRDKYFNNFSLPILS